jgi:hypothetical protein
MKLVKTAEGKQIFRITKEEWERIGNKKGWMKTAMSVLPNTKVYVSGTADARHMGQGISIVLEIGNYQSLVLPLTSFFSQEDIQMMQQDGTLGQQVR